MNVQDDYLRNENQKNLVYYYCHIYIKTEDLTLLYVNDNQASPISELF